MLKMRAAYMRLFFLRDISSCAGMSVNKCEFNTSSWQCLSFSSFLGFFIPARSSWTKRQEPAQHKYGYCQEWNRAFGGSKDCEVRSAPLRRRRIAFGDARLDRRTTIDGSRFVFPRKERDRRRTTTLLSQSYDCLRRRCPLWFGSANAIYWKRNYFLRWSGCFLHRLSRMAV